MDDPFHLSRGNINSTGVEHEARACSGLCGGTSRRPHSYTTSTNGVAKFTYITWELYLDSPLPQ